MKSQLYLWEGLRDLKKKEIILYKDTFKEKIYPVFSNIEDEAERLSNDIYENFMNSPCYCEEDFIDPATIAEDASQIGVDYYQNYSLMRYNTLAMWISMLYQFWEQQVRKFLYDEMRNYFEIEFNEFCINGIRDIKEMFKCHKMNIDELYCWEGVDELRLLCNTLKHGDGKSAEQLRKRRPDFFVKDGLEEFDLLNMYNTTLLEEVLNISEKDYYSYCEILLFFWDELPERMYSDKL